MGPPRRQLLGWAPRLNQPRCGVADDQPGDRPRDRWLHLPVMPVQVHPHRLAWSQFFEDTLLNQALRLRRGHQSIAGSHRDAFEQRRWRRQVVARIAVDADAESLLQELVVQRVLSIEEDRRGAQCIRHGQPLGEKFSDETWRGVAAVLHRSKGLGKEA